MGWQIYLRDAAHYSVLLKSIVEPHTALGLPPTPTFSQEKKIKNFTLKIFYYFRFVSPIFFF
jgi:hypothetical protein